MRLVLKNQNPSKKRHSDCIMKTYIFIALAIAGLIAGSCNRGQETSTAVSTADSIVVNTADSIAVEPEVVKIVGDTTELNGMKTAEEVINWMNATSDSAAYSEGILHQMAKDNLPYTKRLLKNTYKYFIVVDKPSMFVVLYDKYGREKEAYKMACSKHFGTKHKRRDNRTPEGFFSVEGIYDSTKWLYTNDDGYTSPIKGQFGPRFIRLKTPVTTQVGIHGTCAPWSLGRRASHGCIRIHNDNILKLVEYAKPGMPVIVNPGKYDQQINEEEGYTIPSINIGKPTQVVTPPPPTPKDSIADSAALTAADTILNSVADTVIAVADTIIPAAIDSTPSSKLDSAIAVQPDTIATAN